MRGLEVCINADDLMHLGEDVRAARLGGAVRIELCGQMQHDGLTPSSDAMQIARDAFADVPGMLVMIRPRGGDFCYSPDELERMRESIYLAAEQGADGVVLGILNRQAELDMASTKPLVELAKKLSLQVTFHRAFDAIANPKLALEQLIELGISRVLSAGTPWGSGQGALQGLPVLSALLEQAAGRIELVVGGGIHTAVLDSLLPVLQNKAQAWSVHSYSALLDKGRVNQSWVADMVARCQAENRM